MKNRSIKRNWDDVKMVITTLAVTSTVGFWYIFSRLEPRVAANITEKVVPPQPTVTQPVQNMLPSLTPVQPGIIYFQPDQAGFTGISTPQSSQDSTLSPAEKAQNRPAKPEPVTNTRSSR